MTHKLLCLFFIAGAAVLPAQTAPDDKALRLAVAGLVHGHVDGFFKNVKSRTDVQIVGIFDPDKTLHQKYAQSYGFPDTIFFTSLGDMLDQTKPEAVAAFTSTADHPIVVEAAAQRHLPVMMEKPLAVNMDAARAIQRASRNTGIPVIVNYETTWYRSHAAIWQIVKQQQAAGEVRKMVAMDGHEGPKEINVGPEFLSWLTDPQKNGAGALFDFGCYGANLMTWLMDNRAPVSVTAFSQTIKPQIYSRVDDQATILVQYAKAQGVIQASWNWPYSRKDFEVYGEHGYAVATGGNTLHTRLGKDPQEQTPELPSLPSDETDSVTYLKAVTRGRLQPSGLSSLENNMIVTQILTAARDSIQTGRSVKLR